MVLVVLMVVLHHVVLDRGFPRRPFVRLVRVLLAGRRRRRSSVERGIGLLGVDWREGVEGVLVPVVRPAYFA